MSVIALWRSIPFWDISFHCYYELYSFFCQMIIMAKKHNIVYNIMK